MIESPVGAITRRVDEDLARGIDAARRAPSAHNIQPWMFESYGGGVLLGWNPSRDLPHGDPTRHYMLVGLGAAAESFVLGVAAAGGSAFVTFDWTASEHRAAHLERSDDAPSSDDIDLGRAIPYRQTTRWPQTRRAIPLAAIDEMTREAVVRGCRLLVITDRRRIRRAARLTGRGTARNLADRDVFGEFARLLRMSHRDPAYWRDGLTLQTLARGRFRAMSRRIALIPGVMRLMVSVGLHHLAASTQQRLMLRSSAIGLLVAPSTEPADIFMGGRAMLRVWLRATRQGLRVHPMTAALDHQSTREALSAVFGARDGEAPMVALRLGYGHAAPQSPRLPADEVMVSGSRLR